MDIKYEPMQLMTGAEPFSFERGEVGCLLLHGFTGTPHEMTLLGKFLADRNISVLAPRIVGHGTCPEDLNETRWPDWFASAEAALEELKKRCSKVFVSGLSMGGLQTLHLATHHPEIAGIAPLAAPVYVRHWKLTLFEPLMRRTPLLKVYKYDKGVGQDLKDPEALKTHLYYKKTPTACVISLLDYMAHVRADLPKIRMPALIMQSRQDHTVHPGNGQVIHDELGSTDKELVYLENSYHVLPLDYDKETVFEKVHGFIESHA